MTLMGLRTSYSIQSHLGPFLEESVVTRRRITCCTCSSFSGLLHLTDQHKVVSRAPLVGPLFPLSWFSRRRCVVTRVT